MAGLIALRLLGPCISRPKHLGFISNSLILYLACLMASSQY